MADDIIAVFMVLIVIVCTVVFCAVIHEGCLTYQYGPRYYCDERETFQTCDTTIQPYTTLGSDGKLVTVYAPRTDCEYRCIRSHKNPKRTDVEE